MEKLFTTKVKDQIFYLTIKNSGKIIPTIKTITDKHIAKIIKPIVWGSFSNLKLIIEKKDAKRSKTVVISKKFIEKY